MKDKIQIDIGIGDVVKPVEVKFIPMEYKGQPIFSDEISLNVYPPETIFAEKLETIISKGIVNSRMKDYHDLLVMIYKPNLLDVRKLTDSIQATFDRRRTSRSLLIEFDTSGIKNLQVLWANHLKGLGIFKDRLNFPDKISDVIKEINSWIAMKGL